MKKIILLILLLPIVLTTIEAQVGRFSVGAGVSANYFQSAIVDPYLEDFSQVLSHFQLQYQTADVLSKGIVGQVQTNFYTKQIRYGYHYTNTAGGLNREGFRFDYISADIALSAAYNYRLNGRTRLQPRLGYFFSFNKYLGTSEFSSVSGGGVNNTTLYHFNIETNEDISFFHAGILTGLSIIRYTKNDRAVSIFTDFYLSPRNILSEPLTYTMNGDDFELQGKYHYFNMGLRVGLNRK